MHVSAPRVLLEVTYTKRSHPVLHSMEDNGNDGIFQLCLRLPPSHKMFHLSCCVNTRGLACCFLCRDCAADLLPLTLPLFSSWFFVFNPEGNECIAAKAEYCGKCIQAGAKCGWCKDPVCEGKRWLFSTVSQGDTGLLCCCTAQTYAFRV